MLAERISRGKASTPLTSRSLQFWDIARREERLALRGHKEKVTDVAFSPDGAWVATTSDDHTIRIWDARDGQALAVLPGPWFMSAVAFSPRRRRSREVAPSGARTRSRSDDMRPR